ncbi:MAG: hypothetical protein H7240_04350 [Glaciimonas sp.]|nr:hypothetical protein [Glaciimonas sp.]
MKKSRAWPSIVFKVIISIFVLGATFFWINKALVVVAYKDDYLFSTNKFSGVRLSRDTDARSPDGRTSGTNAYAGFLAEATGLVSTVRGGSSFIDQKIIPNSETFNGQELISTHILPFSFGNQYFGMQARIGLKLVRTIGVSRNLKNRWAYLVNRSKQKYLIYIEGVDDESVAWVRGDIPFGFIPEEINILPINKQNEPAIFQLYSDLTHVVRGGVVTTSRPTVMLRHLSYISKIPFIQRFSYLPVVGDVLNFKNGEVRSLRKITPIDGSFFLELDSPVTPYFASNNDIVTVRQTKQDVENNLRIIVSQVTNKDFFFGRERHLKISVDLKNNFPQVGDYITSDRGGARFYISDADQSSVTIDLLYSKLAALCKKLSAKGSKFEFTLAASDGLIESAVNKNIISCESGSAGYELVAKLLKSVGENGSDDKNIIQLLDEPRSDVTDLSLMAVFNRALDMEAVYTCKSCGLTSRLSDKRVIPNVAGRGDIWETYPGSMLNIYYKSLNPAPQELLIHALGTSLSEAYYNKFSIVQPSFVALSNPRQYTPWLYNWHWPYFELMLLNYEKYYSNSDFSIWYRPEKKWLALSSIWDGSLAIDAKFNESPLSITLPVAADEILSLYTLEIEYEIKNPFNGVPLIGTSPRLLISSFNTGAEFPARPPISLPLSVNRFTFPLFVKGVNSKPSLKIEIIDPLKTGLVYKINTIKWRRVIVNSSKIESLLYYAPAYKYVATNIDNDAKLNDILK